MPQQYCVHNIEVEMQGNINKTLGGNLPRLKS